MNKKRQEIIVERMGSTLKNQLVKKKGMNPEHDYMKKWLKKKFDLSEDMNIGTSPNVVGQRCANILCQNQL